MASPLHSLVQTLPIFNYGSASEPPSPPHDSLSEIMTPKLNPNPRNNPPNTVLNVPDDPNSDPSSSYSSSSESYDSSDENYYKQIRRVKENKNKLRSKTRFDDPIKKCAKLTAKLLTDA